MADRYYVSQPIQGDRVTLVESEAHHLARVMRRIRRLPTVARVART